MPEYTAATWDAQLFILELLTSYPGLNDTVGGRIEDGSAEEVTIPDQQFVSYPYIVLGEWASRPQDTFRRQGRTVQVTIHIFSNYRGNKEISVIIGMVQAALHNAPANAGTGWHITLCRLEDDVLLVEPGEIRHYVGRYRIFLQKRTT